MQQVYRYRDVETGLTVEISSVPDRSGRWQRYHDGLAESYAGFGVGHLVPSWEEAVNDGLSHVVTFLAGDDVVGGCRYHGPLQRPEDAAALKEMAPGGDLAPLHDFFAVAIPEGLIELKGGWRATDHPSGATAGGLVGTVNTAMLDVVGARYSLCTAADHAGRRWLETGARELEGLAPSPYPDERYLTRVYVWDRLSPADVGSEAA